MKLKDKIQRDIDEIAVFGYCNFSETFKTLIEAKQMIIELEQQLKNNIVPHKVCKCKNKTNYKVIQMGHCTNCLLPRDRLIHME